MPPTSHTLAAVLRGEIDFTPAAACDYGYVSTLYKQQGRPIPDKRQVDFLSKVYAMAIELYGHDWLHKQLCQGRLRDSLSRLTDYKYNFDWVAFGNE